MKQFAVIGLGRFGISVALPLTKMGYDVLAIDTSEEKVNDIKDSVTHAVQVDAMVKHGVTVIAIRRGDRVIISPGAKQVIETGDILVVVAVIQSSKSWRRGR